MRTEQEIRQELNKLEEKIGEWGNRPNEDFSADCMVLGALHTLLWVLGEN
jgi:hypothetical protein